MSTAVGGGGGLGAGQRTFQKKDQQVPSSASGATIGPYLLVGGVVCPSLNWCTFAIHTQPCFTKS